MATIRGGDIRQFKIKGREFEPAPEASFELMPSGYDNAYTATGNGKAVGVQRRVLGGIDGIEVSIDNGRGDLEYLTELKNAGELVPVNLTLADGSAWTGSMGIEGEFRFNTGEGRASFALRGPKLEQI